MGELRPETTATPTATAATTMRLASTTCGSPLSAERRFAHLYFIVFGWHTVFYEGFRFGIQPLALKENNRIGAAQRQVQHTLRIVCGRRKHDL